MIEFYMNFFWLYLFLAVDITAIVSIIKSRNSKFFISTNSLLFKVIAGWCIYFWVGVAIGGIAHLYYFLAS